jgi:hypothetical protein
MWDEEDDVVSNERAYNSLDALRLLTPSPTCRHEIARPAWMSYISSTYVFPSLRT